MCLTNELVNASTQLKYTPTPVTILFWIVFLLKCISLCYKLCYPLQHDLISKIMELVCTSSALLADCTMHD